MLEKISFVVESSDPAISLTVLTPQSAMEEIARQIPLSPVKRPEWDVRTLRRVGARSVRTDCKIWSRVWSEVEKINYASTPMFMVRAVK